MSEKVNTRPRFILVTKIQKAVAVDSLAAAIALLGVFVAVTQGAVQTGIVFALGAGIFCLRPPPPITPARHPDDRAGRAGPAH